MSGILIICYSFPPNPGVGGRRWAKFAKYLIRSGNTPFIITKEPLPAASSPWTTDTQGANVHFIDFGYPASLEYYPKTLFQKIKYRLAYQYVKLFCGNHYDRSLFSEKKLLDKASELIQTESIHTIVVTCPPFRQAYFSTKLKKRFPSLKLIIDLRDPWTDNTTFLGFDTLPIKKLKEEIFFESSVIDSADKVICVNNYYKDILIKKYPAEKNKFIHIMNGFDPDDIQVNHSYSHTSNDHIITCAGTVYNAVEFLFAPFLKYIEERSSFLRESRIRFRFFGNVDANVKKLILPKHLEFIELCPLLGSLEIHEKINISSAVMMFIAPNHGDNFNTKFYEYIAHRKPILLFSNEGEISKFIESNHLGCHVNKQDLNIKLDSFLNEISSGSFSINYDFNLDAFNIINLTEKLLKVLPND